MDFHKKEDSNSTVEPLRKKLRYTLESTRRMTSSEDNDPPISEMPSQDEEMETDSNEVAEVATIEDFVGKYIEEDDKSDFILDFNNLKEDNRNEARKKKRMEGILKFYKKDSIDVNEELVEEALSLLKAEMEMGTNQVTQVATIIDFVDEYIKEDDKGSFIRDFNRLKDDNQSSSEDKEKDMKRYLTISKKESFNLQALVEEAMRLLKMPTNPTAQAAHEFLRPQTAENAFEADYTDSGGEEAFWRHLEEQKDKWNSNYFPFFAIVQSSGYGKSRLIKQLQLQANSNQQGGRPLIIYLSFASPEAYPNANVTIPETLKKKSKDERVTAFINLFRQALDNPRQDEHTMSLQQNINAPNQSSSNEDVVFILDEVSQLTDTKAPLDGVSLFRCFREASVKFREKYYRNSFFVTLATYTSIHRTIPGVRHDPSLKRIDDPNNLLEPMKPFLLHNTLGLRNNEQDILGLPVQDCLKPENLFAMGRPLWKAFIDQQNDIDDLVKFALVKLLLESHTLEPTKLKIEQSLALLGCRACLTISPVSWFAPRLVGGHMATAVRISQDREEIIVSYPSEPILAVASRWYTNKTNGSFLTQALVHLKTYLTSGAVPKGHRGELIVRILNLLAIDKCMLEDNPSAVSKVKEVKLRDFLMMFSRSGAEVELDPPTQDQVSKKPRVQRALKKLGVENIDEYIKFLNNAPQTNQEVWDGLVCFTHFIYLERGDNTALITPDLLRYAYRRTAAITVDAGRRGIDWIIPVRVAGEVENFIGLCGQDKNRMHDTLQSLTKGSADETHFKMTAQYFLNSEEQNLFKNKGWSLDWPAVLFSIGAEDKEDDFGFATGMTRKRRNADGSMVTYDFPCLVFMGLNYEQLAEESANKCLKELRNFVLDVPKTYEKAVPLTYGVHPHDNDADTGMDTE